jgi:hydrogenase nickel incorporation protein HypB
LLPHVPFELERFLAGVGEVSTATDVLKLSATTGEGLQAWFAWLRARMVQRSVGRPLRTS